jgi:serine/threonine-protein kinase
MSPEQAAGEQDLDARTDVYSLGCMVYEMLAGEPPFTGPNAQSILAKRLTEPVPHLRTVRDVPPAVEEAVTRALARAPSDRFPTAAQFGEALVRAGRSQEHPQAERTGASPDVQTTRRLRRGRAMALGAAVLLLVGIAAVRFWPRSAARLDPDLIAVAPFDVLDQQLSLWHEGLVDILSANLDGAGPLRTVSPTVVVRRWNGHADRASAIQLGEHTGARIAVFGRLTAAGGDSVRVTATLFDVGRRQELMQVERKDVASRVDRLADSLSLDFLRELGRTRPVGTARLVSLGTTTLPALKAFLQGEQFLRHTAWDSALTYYQRALAADSAFAPALRRASLALGWLRSGYDSLSNAYALRAGALNHGLSRRDSLLLVSDSLLASLLEAGPRAGLADSAWWPRARRLLATTEGMTQQYREDPEAWNQLGEARMHVGLLLGTPAAQVVDAFDHAIALDSAFGPAYIHPMEIAMREGPESARRYLVPYLALHPGGLQNDGARLVAQLLDPSRARLLESPRGLDSIPADALSYAQDLLTYWPDSAEIAVRLARGIIGRTSDTYPLSDSLYRIINWSRLSVLRGHMREAVVPRIPLGGAALFADLAMFGMVPADSAAAVFQRGLEGSDLGVITMALPWWTLRRDTVAILATRRRCDSLAASSAESGDRQRARYMGAAASAYFALARLDTTAALANFLALPDSLCPGCYRTRFTTAQLLVARGKDREAMVLLKSELPNLLPAATDVLWELLRATAAERLGDKDLAIHEYQRVVDLWRHADPELQPYVEEARAGLSRLTGEPRR